MTPEEEIVELRKQVKELTEMVAYLTKKLYGQKSEQTDPNQLSLLEDNDSIFSSPEQTDQQSEVTNTNQVPAKKKCKKTRRETVSRHLAVKETIISLPKQQCPQGHQLKVVGKKFVREELRFIPAKLYREEFYTRTYKCETCEQTDGMAHLIQAQPPVALIPHSLASASLVAEVIHKKFELATPLYRQLNDWQQLGIKLSEATLANWVIKASEQVEAVYDALKQTLSKQPYLQGDETPFQVLHEPGKPAKSKSYMWVARTVMKCPQQITLYAYANTRSGAFAQKLYQNFTGVLQCDGYSGYNLLEGRITRVGCWAHVRRKFYDAAQADGNMAKSVPLNLINQMFALEQEWQHFSPRVRRRRRRSRTRKLLKRFWKWIDMAQATPKSRLGKAITYALDQRTALDRLINMGSLDWSNNASERNMKSMVIGRKNWLFSTSPAGAKATAIWLTLVESAKANQVNPQEYITYLLEELPQHPHFSNLAEIVAYLPWNYTSRNRKTKNKIKTAA
ncbi:IS66 family transposase [Pediococcus ethanolidurans]|uniref:IS66 family transposase n=2 Tax=Pediococcus ethanolidurans TaxID=319653 RepID=UPI0021E83757|nr:IS66 family transposase [Pediococcus ethanolidurans]MCV3326863.1 IS66 family transposase [Pediococcus ethanolidurans]